MSTSKQSLDEPMFIDYMRSVINELDSLLEYEDEVVFPSLFNLREVLINEVRSLSEQSKCIM